MANQADFFVFNKLTENVEIARHPEASEVDLTASIAKGGEKRVPMNNPSTTLVINAPAGTDMTNCPFTVESDVDLSIKCSVTNSQWVINIVENLLPPHVPTTVNVTIGEDEPENPPEEPSGS